MSNVLESVESLDGVIRQLHKIESKMRAGNWIDAWRDLRRVIALLENNRKEILSRHKVANAE